MKLKPTQAVAAIASVCALALLAWLFLRPAPQLTDRGYEASMAILRACNQKDSAAIAKVENAIATFTAEGQWSPEDAAAIEEVLILAKDGEWQDAAAQVRNLMLQQSQPISYPNLDD